ncbi:MAG: hypothetical protein Q7J43_15510 [Pseudomonas sp.]|uniref:hypothetical protein n=1 Tax=Pseudomonas sp. TaxID=306 RepID=UPI0027169767|nr:hypothetical protein [Pseudomonas sp.]MDO9619072.1 hypothetical protein [Pseudomonas sp.]
MRLYSALIGVVLLVSGLLAMVFNSDIAEEARLSLGWVFILILAGLFLMYYGRGHLGLWLGYLFSGSDSD